MWTTVPRRVSSGSSATVRSGRFADDSAGVLIENRAAIHAFLLGCNHEMNRELLWREFPSDLRSTVFARFWDRGAPPDDETQDDIKPIASWKGALGANARGAQGDSLVLVVRGELLKRFPQTLIGLNRQTLPASGEWQPAAGQNFDVAFWGALRGDIMFFGFEVTEQTFRANLDEFFFVIYEPPGRYRFGLDVASYAVRSARRDLRRAAVNFPFEALGRDIAVRGLNAAAPAPGPAPAALQKWDDLSWSTVQVDAAGYVRFDTEIHPAAGDAGQWGPNRHSASLASVLFQKPVRVVIAAKRMVG